MNSVHSDDVKHSRVIENVHVPSKATSIIEDISVDSDMPILDGGEIHLEGMNRCFANQMQVKNYL